MPVYQEIFDGPPRSYKRTSSGAPVVSRKRYITIHNTSNTATAEGEAAYAKTRTDGTASHYYVDSDSLIQSTNTDWCVGHVGSTEGNTYGICYEITGINAWTRETWLSNVAWDLLAGAIARDCKQFGIPVRRLTVAEMQTKAMAGFITHNDARLAWGGTTHTDPGPGFPMDHLLNLVSAKMDGEDMSWQEVLTAGPDGKFNAYPAKDWLIGTNIAVWNHVLPTLSAMGKVLEAVAGKVDLDPAELDALKASAAAGAKEGALAALATLSPQEIADAISDEVAADVVDALAARLRPASQ